MSSLTVATSLLPENCSSGFRIIDWPKLFVPESSVEPIPIPKSFPRDSAARRDLGPDDAPERLIARERAAVVDRADGEAEHRPVRLHGDGHVEERALVAVRVRCVLVGAPLRPLHRPVELAGEQAAGRELRMEGDLVAEAAADVLAD